MATADHEGCCAHKRPGSAPARTLRLHKRLPIRVQARLHKTADKDHEAYRSYLLKRLLAPMAEVFGRPDMAAGGIFQLAAGDLQPIMHSITRILEACPTSTLEGRLEEFYEGLLQVRIAVVLETCVQVHERRLCCATGLSGDALDVLPGLVWWARALWAPLTLDLLCSRLCFVDWRPELNAWTQWPFHHHLIATL